VVTKQLFPLLFCQFRKNVGEKKAQSYIQFIGYYRLSAYMFPFLMMPKEDMYHKVFPQHNISPE